MLRKLLKHDFKSVFRYWRILLPSMPVLMLLIGLSIRFMNWSSYIVDDGSDGFLHTVFMTFLMIFVLFALILISASALVTPILCLVRFYKHFFTDEGYLTFTLPVKRSTLFLSKTVNAMIFHAMYSVVMVVGILLAFFVIDSEMLFSFFDAIRLLFFDIPTEFCGWVFLYLIEGVLLLLALTLFSTMLLYFSVTVGALIVKKARLVIGLAIYYGINWVLSGISQILLYAVFPSSITEIGNLLLGKSDHAIFASLATVFLILIAITATLSLTLYSMTLGRLEKKLNLP